MSAHLPETLFQSPLTQTSLHVMTSASKAMSISAPGNGVIGVARLPDVVVVDQNIRVLPPDVPVSYDTDITGLAPPSVLVVQAGIGVRSARYGACSGIVAGNNAEVHSATARDK